MGANPPGAAAQDPAPRGECRRRRADRLQEGDEHRLGIVGKEEVGSNHLRPREDPSQISEESTHRPHGNLGGFHTVACQQQSRRPASHTDRGR